MNRHPRPEVAAAILASLGLLLSGCNGGSGNDGTPTVTTPPTSSSPVDAGSSRPPHLFDGAATPLEPGKYQLSFVVNTGEQTPDAVIEVPSGFNGGNSWYVVSPDGDAILGLWTVGQVDRDACLHAENDAFDPGPSVKDLADALVAQKSTRASAPEPVNVAGSDGLYVEVASPNDLSRCGKYPGLWREAERGIFSDGQVDKVWILDFDGQRLVVDASYGPTATASERHNLTSMVNSLEFVPMA